MPVLSSSLKNNNVLMATTFDVSYSSKFGTILVFNRFFFDMYIPSETLQPSGNTGDSVFYNKTDRFPINGYNNDWIRLLYVPYDNIQDIFLDNINNGTIVYVYATNKDYWNGTQVKFNFRINDISYDLNTDEVVVDYSYDMYNLDLNNVVTTPYFWVRGFVYTITK